MKPLPRLLSFMATTMAILLLTFSTFAGSTSIRDNVGLLSTADRDQLLTTSFQWPFDATVLIENVEKDTLRAHASSQVTAPNMVVIALSPTKRSTVVRFGSGTNVDQGHWESIAKAGNGAFKEDRWRAGIEAIGFRAKVAVEEARLSVAAPQRPQATNLPVHEQNAITSMWIAIGLTVVFFTVLAWWMVRRHRRQTEELQATADKLSCEAADIVSKTIKIEERRERAMWEGVEVATRNKTRQIASQPARSSHDLPRTQPIQVPVQPSAPAPVYATQTTTVVHERGGGSSDFAMGLLVGDALNDRHSDHHHHHYESPAPPSSRKNYDSGGTSSSWGSVFESNSSDSGGSESSWDSPSSSSSDSGFSESSWDSVD